MGPGSSLRPIKRRTPTSSAISNGRRVASHSPTTRKPTDKLHDLASYILLNDSTSTVHYSYGVDTPVAGVADVYHSQPNAPLAFANNTWSVIAWATTQIRCRMWCCTRHPPAVKGAPSLDFASRRRQGIEKTTYKMLKEGVRGLASNELNGLLTDVKVLIQDGARDGLPWPACNATCMTNGE